jgi:hypothetical protein
MANPYREREAALQAQAERDRVRLRPRDGIDPALATSRAARAATPVPAAVVKSAVVKEAPAIGPPSVTAVPPPGAAPELRGAVRVGGFPPDSRTGRTRYPFPELARDGGVWRIDPATWGAKPLSIRSAANKWAHSHGYTAQARTGADGMLYLQFSRTAAR